MLHQFGDAVYLGTNIYFSDIRDYQLAYYTDIYWVDYKNGFV